MKSIIEYITEKFKINSKNVKQSIDSLFNGINVNDWHWQNAYSDKEYMNKCKDNVLDFAQHSKELQRLYPNSKPYEREELLYRDTYRIYIGINSKKSESFLDDQYEEEMQRLDKIIKESGWGNYKNNCLPQGWFVFIDWVIKKKK